MCGEGYEPYNFSYTDRFAAGCHLNLRQNSPGAHLVRSFQRETSPPDPIDDRIVPPFRAHAQTLHHRLLLLLPAGFVRHACPIEVE